MSDATKNCRICGELILAVARKCRYCGEYLDPAARQANRPSATDRALFPVGRPVSAIAAGYLGLLAFFPLIGIALGLAAVICGISALKTIGADPALSGKGRAWFGIVAGAAAMAIQILLIVFVVIEVMSRQSSG
jgi:hypothetical protein